MARSARVKADGAAYYHVVSRVANRAFLFGDAKRKGRILDFLRRSAEFSGVDEIYGDRPCKTSWIDCFIVDISIKLLIL